MLAACGVPSTELTVGQASADRLKKGETRWFHVTLAVGEFIRVEVIQHSVDVVVRLHDPAGDLRIEHDKLTGTTRPERLLWTADEPGRHRVEITALDRPDNEGRFEVILDARRVAGEEDQLRVSAELAFAAGKTAARDQATPEAIQSFEEALALWRALADLSRQADVWYQLGKQHYKHDKQRAMEAFGQMLEVLGQEPNPWQQGDAHHWLGHLHYGLNDLELARDHYLRALDSRQQAGFAAGEAQTRNNLGLTLFFLGDAQQALEHYEAALGIWRRIGDRPGEARTLHNRGRYYLFLGQADEALDDLEKALETRRSDNLRGRAANLHAIGLAHSRKKDPQRALAALHQALDLRRKSGSLFGQAVALIDIGGLHHKLERFDQARSTYEEALRISDELSDRLIEASALHGLGRGHATRGQPAEALELFEAAFDRFEAIRDREGRVMTLRSMSLAERRLGRWADARGHLEAALSTIEGQRLALASHSLRYSFFATKQSYYDFYVDLLMEMHRHEPSAGYDSEALAASERARARSQLDTLTDSGAELRRGVDPSLREHEQTLQRQIESVERQRRWLLEEGSAADRLAQHERKLRDLFREYSRVQGKIRLASPRYAALTQPRTLSAAEIQGQVDDETLLLEIDLGPRSSFLWVVARDAVHSFELPPEAEIEKAARRAYNLLRSSHDPVAEVPAELALEELSDMVLGPAAEELGDKRLVIVCEGALQYIPFAALPEPRASTADHGGAPSARHLGATHEIVSIPSASMLAALRDQRQGRSPAEGLIAVLADPVFELDDPRVRGLASHPAPGARVRGGMKPSPRRFERLAFSQLEADRILALVSPDESYRASGFKADRDAVVSGKLSDYRLLHFATHGELNTEYPELSRLVLSRVDEQGAPRQNDSVFAHEIYDLDLPADLVVLSACETALGAEIRGEGLLGLAQGFFYAGAERVLVSLWKVDDEATAELMADFYERLLARGQRPARALKEAQAAIRGHKRWQAPYFWAGFALLGEWE